MQTRVYFFFTFILGIYSLNTGVWMTQGKIWKKYFIKNNNIERNDVVV